MLSEQETMTIVVDREGNNGICSHCNNSTSIMTEVHDCGARASALAIEERANVTFNDAALVSAKRHDLEFIGTGRIVKSPRGRLWLQVTRRPGDLP